MIPALALRPFDLAFILINQNPESETVRNVQQDTMVEFDNSETEDVKESENEMTSEVSAAGDSYMISDNSSVSYTVQKEFLSRPTEPVTGTTSDVSGELSINTETESISINAVINSQTLDSGSGTRDNHVRNEFSGDILVKVDNFNFEISEQVSFVAPVELTINGITKTLNFDIQGIILEEEISFKGSSDINMTDFNIDPPSTLGIYGVNEIAEISFDLFAN
jgi:polyisoprenoid-binding protein YceI